MWQKKQKSVVHLGEIVQDTTENVNTMELKVLNHQKSVRQELLLLLYFKSKWKKKQ